MRSLWLTNCRVPADVCSRRGCRLSCFLLVRFELAIFVCTTDIGCRIVISKRSFGSYKWPCVYRYSDVLRCFLTCVHVSFWARVSMSQRNNLCVRKFYFIGASGLFANCNMFTNIENVWMCFLVFVYEGFSVALHMNRCHNHCFLRCHIIFVYFCLQTAMSTLKLEIHDSLTLLSC